MMGKRLAETQLTPEELEKNLNDDHETNANGASDQASAQEMAGRKILKVKRHMPGDKIQEEQGKGNFKLSGSFGVAPAQPVTSIPKPVGIMFKVPEQQTTFAGSKLDVKATPFFPVAATPEGAMFKAPTKVTFAGKTLQESPAANLTQPPAEVKTSFFGGQSLFGQEKPATQSLFGGAAEKPTVPTEKPAAGSLFGGASMFGADKTKIDQPTSTGFNFGSAAAPTGGLFGSAAPPTGGLFGSGTKI